MKNARQKCSQKVLETHLFQTHFITENSKMPQTKNTGVTLNYIKISKIILRYTYTSENIKFFQHSILCETWEITGQ